MGLPVPRNVLIPRTKDVVLTDLQETIKSVVKASDLPLSILIILDAQNGHQLQSSSGRIAKHDIVQFVPMREVHRHHDSHEAHLCHRCRWPFPTHIPVVNTEEPTREFVRLLKDKLAFIQKKMVTISLFQMMTMHLMKMMCITQVLSLWTKVTRSFLVVVS